MPTCYTDSKKKVRLYEVKLEHSLTRMKL